MKVTLTSCQALWLNELRRDTKEELRERGMRFCIFCCRRCHVCCMIMGEPIKQKHVAGQVAICGRDRGAQGYSKLGKIY